MTNATADFTPLEGGCTCRAVRYRLEARPIVVHCCHCTWCQRETGSAFAVNAVVETARVIRLAAEPVPMPVPSASGRGQIIHRCPNCHVAVWSNYSQAGPAILFVRAGTVDEPQCLPPDIHIYTSTRQPWVAIPEGVAAVPEFYAPAEIWPPDALARFHAARAAGQSYAGA